MNIVAFIFARGGSKGVPGKNIRPFLGKPLIAHAIATARGSRHVSRVVVSTDDPAIAAVAREHGAEVPFLRPADLAGDTSAEWLAWRHAIDTVESTPDAKKIDVFVSVPAVCPLRTSADVDACIELLLASDADIVLTATPANRHPMYTILSPKPDGTVGIFTQPPGRIVRRQDAPPALDLVAACYVTRPAFIRANDHLFAGRARAIVIPQERAVDIDTELDFAFAEFLATRTPSSR